MLIQFRFPTVVFTFLREKLSIYGLLTHYKAQFFLFTTENLSLAKHKGKICFFLIIDGRCNRYFGDIQLKIYRLPNFNKFFQFLLETNCFVFTES